MEIKEIKSAQSAYPPLLKEIGDPPESFFLSGDEASLHSPALAIVGTRRATESGRELAGFFSRYLSQAGFVIVSGLAMGIDTAAHEAAVEVRGRTVAVLANGLDKIYPAQNENLAKKILAEGGALISEYPAGTPPYKDNFLRRNRLISGLAWGTIIIEAPERSGALATARFAGEQGREVFVLPGPVNQPNFTGSHKLIRDGARLVSSPRDILEDLGWEASEEKKEPDASDLEPNEKIILAFIESAGQTVSIDKIIEITKLQPQVVSQSLTFLLIKDLIKESGGKYGI